MKITRFFATPSGDSQFQEVEIPLIHEVKDEYGNVLRYSRSYSSPSVSFVESPEGMAQSWHNAPARQIVTILSGVLEVTTSDHKTRRWGAGEQFLADDTTGKGHETRTVGGATRMIIAQFPKEFDLDKWLVK